MNANNLRQHVLAMVVVLGLLSSPSVYSFPQCQMTIPAGFSQSQVCCHSSGACDCTFQTPLAERSLESFIIKSAPDLLVLQNGDLFDMRSFKNLPIFQNKPASPQTSAKKKLYSFYSNYRI